MISIITPLLNEEEYVLPFLDHLGKMEDDFELILVDGGSLDDTLRLVRENMTDVGRATILLETNQGRAVQMNKGAKKAKGDILLFLHADCFIPHDSIKVIEREVAVNATIGGAFKQAFTGSHSFLKIVSHFGNLRSGLTSTFFGDYGIFLKKNVFQEIGGYDAAQLLEDVDICRRAKSHGKLVQIDRYLFTSPRRYLEKGKLKLTILFILACIMNFLGRRPRFLVNHIVNR